MKYSEQKCYRNTDSFSVCKMKITTIKPLLLKKKEKRKTLCNKTQTTYLHNKYREKSCTLVYIHILQLMAILLVINYAISSNKSRERESFLFHAESIINFEYCSILILFIMNC